MTAEAKKECIDAIKDAARQLQTLLEILEEDEPDTPLAFLETAQDAQYQINRAVAAALRPILGGSYIAQDGNAKVE